MILWVLIELGKVLTLKSLDKLFQNPGFLMSVRWKISGVSLAAQNTFFQLYQMKNARHDYSDVQICTSLSQNGVSASWQMIAVIESQEQIMKFWASIILKHQNLIFCIT